MSYYDALRMETGCPQPVPIGRFAPDRREGTPAPFLLHAVRVFALAALAAAAAVIAARAHAGGAPGCAGDCSGDGTVTIDELVRAVNIALGTAAVETCSAADLCQDGAVQINELVRAVNSALTSCGDRRDVIVFESLNLQPEGIEYDETRRQFLVGSRTQGIIHAVDDDGTFTVLLPEPGLVATLGLHIDRANGRLLAAGSLDASNALALGIYDLATGDTIDVVDLTPVAAAGPHLANDVVTDADGNAYVTDTLTTGIYRVDPDGTASLFAGSPQLARANGIEIYDNRFLIVATLTGPSLLRVPLDDPLAVSAITTDVPIAGDGIVFTTDGDLAVVGGAANAGTVLRLRSDDDWQSATVVGSWDATQVGAGAPTTAAARGNDVHVVFAHLFDQTRELYEIARVRFE